MMTEYLYVHELGKEYIYIKKFNFFLKVCITFIKRDSLRC